MQWRAFIAVPLLVLAGTVDAAEPDREMARCAVVEDGVRRLECYDALSQARGVAGPEVKRSEAGKWTLREDVSKIDDSKNVYLYVEAVEPVSGQLGWKKARPMLWVRCVENATAVVFNFDRFITTGTATPTIRIDKEPARDMRMSMATNNNAFGLWSGKAAIPFIKRMFGKDRLLVRVTPYGDNAVTAEFEIAGLREAIGPLAEACHWRPTTSLADESNRKQKEKEFLDSLDMDSTETADGGNPRDVARSAQVIGTRLTAGEKDVLRRQIEQCWNVPIGARNPEELVVEIRIQINRDRTVRDAVIVDNARAASDRFFRTMAESVRRAVMNPKCSPLKLLPEKYDEWKDMTLLFDPSKMVGR